MAASTGGDPSADESDSFSYKIIIVGAGIAGISAASQLIKLGETDFKVLEARERIGGRIYSVPMGNTVVDLGATWIHGVLGNPMYELAMADGLIDITTEQQPHAVVATTEEGKRVPISVVEEVYSAYFWFSKRCEEYFILKKRPPPYAENSVGKHIACDISSYLQQFQGEDCSIRRMIFDHLLIRETCITGCHSMDETSLSEFGSYTELPGGNVSVPGGFYSIIDSLVQSLPTDCIRLKSVVKHIRWKQTSENSEMPKNDLETHDENKTETRTAEYNKVFIMCSDGTKWYTNHVILTLPVGVLKFTADEVFEPSLPDYKLECLGKLCFGTVNKIYLEYDRPFLNPEITEVITLWNRTDECDMDKIWFRKIYSFSRYSENILLAWLSGHEAEYLETLTMEQVGETCTHILRKFLNDPYVPKPCKVICTNWNSEPYSKGSYVSIGVKGSLRDIELLARPIYSDPYQAKPQLMFAGEGTHSTFYSTTHGAYLSGKAVAEFLLEPEHELSFLPTTENAGGGRKDLSSWLRGIDLT